MEILLIVVAALWVAGFVRELARLHRSMDKNKISYPYPGCEYVTAVILFFSWPYFYFYGGD